VHKQLAELEGHNKSAVKGHKLTHVVGSCEVLSVTFVAVLTAIVKTIFILDSRMSINRTAMILIAFLVVHLVRSRAHLQFARRSIKIASAVFAVGQLDFLRWPRGVQWVRQLSVQVDDH